MHERVGSLSLGSPPAGFGLECTSPDPAVFGLECTSPGGLSGLRVPVTPTADSDMVVTFFPRLPPGSLSLGVKLSHGTGAAFK